MVEGKSSILGKTNHFLHFPFTLHHLLSILFTMPTFTERSNNLDERWRNTKWGYSVGKLENFFFYVNNAMHAHRYRAELKTGKWSLTKTRNNFTCVPKFCFRALEPKYRRFLYLLHYKSDYSFSNFSLTFKPREQTNTRPRYYIRLATFWAISTSSIPNNFLGALTQTHVLFSFKLKSNSIILFN